MAAAAEPRPPPLPQPDSELDSDPDELWDDINLSLLARLRLGGQGAAALDPPRPAATTADVHAAARQAIREVATDAEMSALPCSTVAQQQRPASGSDLSAAAAAVHERLEQLRSSLRSPCCSAQLLPQPPAGLAQVAAGAELPWRRRVEAGDLVVTRPPSRAATVPAAPAFDLHTQNQQQQWQYCSTGDTAAGRLAALMLQSDSPLSAPPPLPRGSSSGSGAFTATRLQPQQHCSGCSSPRHVPPPICRPTPALPPPAYHSTAALAATAGRLWAAPASVSAAARPPAGIPASGGDILAEWRRRRQAQPGQPEAGRLADKYSRFLSLRQEQPELATSPVPSVQRSEQRLLPCALLPGAPGSTASRLPGGRGQQGTLHGGVAIETAAAAPQRDDILERWRARRRQQGQAASSGPDLSALLTLRPPSAAPAVEEGGRHAARALLAAAHPTTAAAATQRRCLNSAEQGPPVVAHAMHVPPAALSASGARGPVSPAAEQEPPMEAPPVQQKERSRHCWHWLQLRQTATPRDCSPR